MGQAIAFFGLPFHGRRAGDRKRSPAPNLLLFFGDNLSLYLCADVYLGSYNFSTLADVKNGENLLLIRGRRIAVSYTVEALRIFDHYHFRVVQQEAKKAKKKLELAKPPRNPGDKPWWAEDYTNARKIRDRELFAKTGSNSASGSRGFSCIAAHRKRPSWP